jgi:hypothetical protein
MATQCATAVTVYFDEALGMAMAYLEDAEAACVSLELCAKKPCAMHAMMGAHALEHSVTAAQRAAYGAAQLSSSEDDSLLAPRLVRDDDGSDVFIVFTEGRSDDNGDDALRPPEESSAFSTTSLSWFTHIPLFLDWATSSSSSSSSSSDALRLPSSDSSTATFFFYSDEVLPSSSSSSSSSDEAMPSSSSDDGSYYDMATVPQEASEVDIVFEVADAEATGGFLQSLKSLTTMRPRAFGPW